MAAGKFSSAGRLSQALRDPTPHVGVILIEMLTGKKLFRGNLQMLAGRFANAVDVWDNASEMASCEPTIPHYLRDMGYEVKINEPYKGVELVRRYSDPAKGRHSLQLEINRKLYMDERRIEKSAGFAELQANLDRLSAAICGYAREHSG